MRYERRFRIVESGEEARSAIAENVPALSVVQRDFLFSGALYRKFSGGRGSGKSRVGVEAAVNEAGRYKCTGCVVAPTYPSLADIVLPAFKDIAHGITRTYYKSTRVAELVNGSVILFRSGDDPERLRGPNLSWFWMDEACQQSRDVWDILLPCLREGGRMGRAWLTTTPLGHDWVWDLFNTDDADYASFRARMEDNPFTSARYKEKVRHQYGVGWKARQELDGEECEAEGPHFSRSWFEVRVGPVEYRYTVRGWDLAASVKTGSDYTVGVKVGKAFDGTFWVLDVVRGQWEWPRALEIIRSTAKRDGYDCVQAVETPAMQLALAQQIVETLRGHAVKKLPRIKDKVTYALPIATALETGAMFLVPGRWNEPFIDEFVSFDGKGRVKDDQVDATANAFGCMVRVEPGVEFVRTRVSL